MSRVSWYPGGDEVWDSHGRLQIHYQRVINRTAVLVACCGVERSKATEVLMGVSQAAEIQVDVLVHRKPVLFLDRSFWVLALGGRCGIRVLLCSKGVRGHQLIDLLLSVGRALRGHGIESGLNKMVQSY